ITPFIDVCNECDKGVFILVKTSNPSSGEFQDRVLHDEDSTLYEAVGFKVREWAKQSMDGYYSNIGAVVGATYPKMGEILRRIMPKSYILVPGYGAQGASGKDLKPFFDYNGLGAIINSSRGIIAAYRNEKYAKFGEDGFADAARAAVLDMKEDIRQNAF
ncbi:MAG: orotidine-5'-phosphate decarboxylase, partial [Spirochaetales bacterium]|nr:orotidine-5'-phosphate decarboxylase [Spirochaetales bacterium]